MTIIAAPGGLQVSREESHGTLCSTQAWLRALYSLAGEDGSLPTFLPALLLGQIPAALHLRTDLLPYLCSANKEKTHLARLDKQRGSD